MPTYKIFDAFRIELRSRDHAPPHFHAVGPDFHALVTIRDLQVLRGTITRRALSDVVAWADGRRDELMAEWRRLNERD